MWPHFGAVYERAQQALQEAANGGDLRELEERFTTRVPLAVANRNLSPGLTGMSRQRATSQTNITSRNATGAASTIVFAPNQSTQQLGARKGSVPAKMSKTASVKSMPRGDAIEMVIKDYLVDPDEWN